MAELSLYKQEVQFSIESIALWVGLANAHGMTTNNLFLPVAYSIDFIYINDQTKAKNLSLSHFPRVHLFQTLKIFRCSREVYSSNLSTEMMVIHFRARGAHAEEYRTKLDKNIF